jgi:hypothetical protein
VGGLLNLVTGPLEAVTVYPGHTYYEQAAGGSIHISFDLLLPGGGIHNGTFSAPLVKFLMGADNVSWNGQGGGQVDTSIGPGQFDKATAQLLGIAPHTLATDQFLHTDNYDAYQEPHRLASCSEP